jgi:hypothetical protein
MSRTREAPTPTNISMNSVPAMEKKGTPASPEMALASSVLPVPGGPTSSPPAGDRAPSAMKRAGSRRKATISMISALTWSMPAMSAKVMGDSPAATCSMRAPPKILSRFFLRPTRKANLTSRKENQTGKTRRRMACTTGSAGLGSGVWMYTPCSTMWSNRSGS